MIRTRPAQDFCGGRCAVWSPLVLVLSGSPSTAEDVALDAMVAADKDMGPVPEDVRAWAATRTDVSIGDTGGSRSSSA